MNVFPQFKFSQRLQNFDKLNNNLKNMYDYKLLLALLILDESDNHEFFCYKYKVSNNIKERLENISKNYENLKNKKLYSNENLRKLVYFTDRDSVRDILLFARCMNNKLKDFDLKNFLNYVEKCEIPKFPISGEDLKKYGYESGEKLGKKLQSLKEKWIENNFFLDKKTIERSLNKIN